MEKIKVGEEKIDIEEIIKISKGAGEMILKIYNEDFEVYQKKDDSRESGYSALTEADIQANELIVRALKESYPTIPIITEESKEVPFAERKNWEYFWMVDPLDGTKDFVKRNGEFTVNIALIKNGYPVLGVVYVPVKDILYFGDEANGSFKKVGDEEPVKLPMEQKRNSYVVVASRSHSANETADFIEKLKEEHPNLELKSFGSSLKFCMVAEGEADMYPRLGETSEWDTAAAHAVVNFSGKKVYEFGKDWEIRYNKEKLLNPWFVVK